MRDVCRFIANITSLGQDKPKVDVQAVCVRYVYWLHARMHTTDAVRVTSASHNCTIDVSHTGMFKAYWICGTLVLAPAIPTMNIINFAQRSIAKHRQS